jgi:hypothetical protein
MASKPKSAEGGPSSSLPGRVRRRSGRRSPRLECRASTVPTPTMISCQSAILNCELPLRASSSHTHTL